MARRLWLQLGGGDAVPARHLVHHVALRLGHGRQVLARALLHHPVERRLDRTDPLRLRARELERGRGEARRGARAEAARAVHRPAERGGERVPPLLLL
eukprot:CAMPEP_0195570728 /NCGR_PEP_ID=MMETSP0814-20130614/3646_1 /TAXON_ID=97485 /ORGANISM="Prymnesium parvum, Strain Texoma1" /LENGTH=97 /DNA_ID=CAMNT_0040706267 /DNA_START=44 /DNA_END=333 /DNA_ORIENTATION=-